jgi:hypothetical protein
MRLRRRSVGLFFRSARPGGWNYTRAIMMKMVRACTAICKTSQPLPCAKPSKDMSSGIVTGKVAPDTRLRAEALAEQLEVSRTPVRSALALLSAEGLVSYSVNRGYTVRAIRRVPLPIVVAANDIEVMPDCAHDGLKVMP